MTQKSCFRRAALCGVLACLLGALAGCGADRRCPVAGMVTLDRVPLAEGTIQFRPASGSEGNTAGAVIVNGKYSIEARNGLHPGQYSVHIETVAKTGRKLNDPWKGMVDETIDVKYREMGRLSATIVPGKNENVDFAITAIR